LIAARFGESSLNLCDFFAYRLKFRIIDAEIFIRVGF
jgi:hypothetical protein